MKVAVVAANGKAGKLITKEAVNRGMDVTAIVRGENKTVAPKAIIKDLFEITKEDLKDYVKFKNILIQFKKFYNIDEYNLRDIDKYLWIAGKEYFPKKY